MALTTTTLLTTAIALPVSLWTFKCAMLVAFQRKIIYMGYSPMGARSEELSAADQRVLDVEVISTQVSDRVRLDGITARRKDISSHASSTHSPILFYLQGNAGNPLSRLPVFEKLLGHRNGVKDLQVIAYAPSSYWTSTRRRPTQKNLLEDYTKALQHTRESHTHSPIFVYGHSLGGAIAVLLAASDTRKPTHTHLILENAFASIPAMVKAYFVSPKTPYYHLHKLAFDKWDALDASKHVDNETLVLVSENDELVPRSHGEALHNALPHSRLKVIQGALHENAYTKQDWAKTVHAFIEERLTEHARESKTH
ncbi:hypothetical protein E3P99_00808 [Wallemia hederae]|uniref:Serine aminopeptidase S33 domain-containing protein n=1 Tax=Wallemia hederae TaxID=1540922 RepID=A0A4V4LTX6_9BASI|nr:hypothetical protein E3P99_00808 [Wallemia hederae]